jgi:BioD-like phosphotransacetylase family protein
VDNINPMEALLWILLPGFVALASGLLSWFIMQSRMEVKLAEQREMLATERGALDAEKVGVRMSLDNAIRAAEEGAKREALDSFLSELTIEQRHYTRENRLLMHNRKSLILQERMYFRNIPLSDWIEHEIVMEEGQDVTRLVQDMTIFDREVVSIAEASRPKRQLA